MEAESIDARFPKYMTYCVLVACLGSFSNGWVIGSPNVPGEITHNCPNGNAHIHSSVFPDCLPMDNALWGFAVASFCVGGLLGGLSGGALQTKVGRRRAIMLNNWGYILGGVLIGCSTHTGMFIVGRILCGIGCGLGSLSIPTYIGEVSTVKARGAMGTCNQFFIVIGILLSSVIGLPLANVPLWRLNYAIVAIPAVFQFFLMNTCVETPRYLVSVNRIEDARAALQKLRGPANIDREFYGMVEGYFGTAAAQSMTSYHTSDVPSDEKKEGTAVSPVPAATAPAAQAQPRAEDVPTEGGQHETDHLTTSVVLRTPDTTTNGQQGPDGFDIATDDDLIPAPHTGVLHGDQNTMNIIQIFKDPVIRRIACTVICLHASQQLVGINAVMYYSTTIFNIAFDPDFSKYMAIITTVVNFVMTVISVIAIDRLGRRPLLLLSNAGACIFSVLLVIGYVYTVPGLLVASVFMYVASFAIGIGPIPWLMTSELTPVSFSFSNCINLLEYILTLFFFLSQKTYASSSVGSVATCVNWAMNFLIGQIFPVIFAAIKGYSFVIFAVIGALAFTFTLLCVPETKGRTLESIVGGYEKFRR